MFCFDVLVTSVSTSRLVIHDMPLLCCACVTTLCKCIIEELVKPALAPALAPQPPFSVHNHERLEDRHQLRGGGTNKPCKKNITTLTRCIHVRYNIGIQNCNPKFVSEIESKLEPKFEFRMDSTLESRMTSEVALQSWNPYLQSEIETKMESKIE